MELTLGILQVLGIFVGLPAVVGLAIAGGFLLKGYKRAASVYQAMTCSIDADCPRGYVCRNGICVPQS